MFRLHVVQAALGDCLLLAFGTAAAPRFVLIDGGPAGTWQAHLRPVLTDVVGPGGRLDLVMLSHVDNDHVLGLLDLAADVRAERANGDPETVRLGNLWHNSFARTLDPDGAIATRLAAAMASAGAAAATMTSTGMALQGIGEGNRLRQHALALGVPINGRSLANPKPGGENTPITPDTLPRALRLGNLRLKVIGPSQANLDALRADWLAWLDAHEDELADPQLAANADRSVPNLSSIIVLATADGRRLLLTGDGRGDHILSGLAAAHLLPASAPLHVDVFKLPHHGSIRNLSAELFDRIIADTYVVSADGTHGNPDLETLVLLVDAAHRQGRAIEIVATNRTPSTDALLAQRDPAVSGYRLTVMGAGGHRHVVTLA